MNQCENYQLIDFGDQRKLERFGHTILDRPSPAARRPRDLGPSQWQEADFRFDIDQNHQGTWKSVTNRGRSPVWNWANEIGIFELKLTPFGHIGVFPEQIDNWKWIASNQAKVQGLNILNLFAYTGGTTLALAKYGARVVHVDSAANVVKWARKNAQLSSLENAPIRWITEDALRFVHREIKRGNRYDGFVADPPTFGHGPKNERWAISENLPEMLNALSELTSGAPRFCIFTNHTEGFGPQTIGRSFGKCFDKKNQYNAHAIKIASQQNKLLSSGYMIRFVEPV
jgi:23S rRNA (cytosine1962-C5)-methyltransferase